MFVQVPEAHDQGGGGDGHKQRPGEPAHPGTVRQAIPWTMNGPGGQATLVQLQQTLILLPQPCESVYTDADELEQIGALLVYSSAQICKAEDPREEGRTFTSGHSAAGSVLSLKDTATVL